MRFYLSREILFQAVEIHSKTVTHSPDDGGKENLWNAGKILPDYTTQQPRCQPSYFIIV
jgi:hypothetical protein